MTRGQQHRILVATDGSASASAALDTALRFPWGASAQLHGVVGCSTWVPLLSKEAASAIVASFDAIADETRQALARRWPEAKVAVLDQAPVDAILAEAERLEATAIVLGWRGHGTFRRLLAGSVARTVAARAKCPVLVVRDPPSAIRRLIIGFDGSPNAQRAVEFVCSLTRPRGGAVVLVNVMQPVLAPASLALLPASSRAYIRHEVAAINKERHDEAQRIAKAAAAQLKQAGWRATSDIRLGAPLAGLLAAVVDHRADVLVVGARATSGIERALLGSVANGAVNNARLPVLVVR